MIYDIALSFMRRGLNANSHAYQIYEFLARFQSMSMTVDKIVPIKYLKNFFCTFPNQLISIFLFHCTTPYHFRHCVRM